MYCSPGHSASTEPRKVHRMLEDRKRPKLSLLHICPLLPALNVWLESLLKFYEKKKKFSVLNSTFLAVYVWYHAKGFPGGSVGKNLLQWKRQRFDPWVRKIPLEEEMATPSSILAWRIPTDRGPRRATAHGVTKSWTGLRDWIAAPLEGQRCLIPSVNNYVRSSLHRSCLDIKIIGGFEQSPAWALNMCLIIIMRTGARGRERNLDLQEQRSQMQGASGVTSRLKWVKQFNSTILQLGGCSYFCLVKGEGRDLSVSFITFSVSLLSLSNFVSPSLSLSLSSLHLSVSLHLALPFTSSAILNVCRHRIINIHYFLWLLSPGVFIFQPINTVISMNGLLLKKKKR